MMLFWTLPLTVMLSLVLIMILADDRVRRRKVAQVAAIVIAIALIPIASLAFYLITQMVGPT